MLKMTKTDFQPSEQWRIVKNVAVIGFAFMIHFTAYYGTVNLQSSINAEAGLGVASLATACAGTIVSNLFLPAFVIKYLGTKWSICVGSMGTIPYFVAQLRPTFYSMLPTAFLMGLGSGPAWCAKCVYVSVVSEVAGQLTNTPASLLMSRYLGLFYTIYNLSNISGNLISSLVISSGNNMAAVTSLNASEVPVLCGANFLPSEDAATALQQQPPEKILMLVCIFSACVVGTSLIIIFGVDSMDRYKPKEENAPKTSVVTLLLITLGLLREPKQLLMIVMTVFAGLSVSFFTADFTAGFVSCAIGTGSVGYIMLTYGVANTISCATTGYLVKMTGRVPLMTFALVVQSALFITLLIWRPQLHLGYVQYIIAVFWGICNSIWQVQVNAFVAALFPGQEEAAFSNFRLWESVGYIIAFIWSSYLRSSTKLYVLFVSMIVGMLFYYIVEYTESKKNKKAEEKSCKI